MGHNGINPI